MTEHLARLCWVPAIQHYQVVCTKCDEVLVDDIDKLDLFLWAGECVPGETLGIQAHDNIQTGDHFGGVKE